MVTLPEWIGRFVGVGVHEDIDELNRVMGGVLDEYNAVASELLDDRDGYIDRVATLCASPADGSALLDWNRGFVDAMELRPEEWLAFVERPSTGDLLVPLQAIADIAGTPEKRRWLADDELRRNLSRGLGIVGARTWELWRANPPMPAERGRGRATKGGSVVADDTVHRLKITLLDVAPQIWRRVDIPSATKLPQVSRILLAAMGWEDYHLHEFVVGDTHYGTEDPEFPRGVLSERGRTLAEIAPRVRDRFDFEYDFCDGWRHRVTVEAIIAREEGVTYPRCTGGARACPPEDCGGPPGYEELLETLADPQHDEHEAASKWAGASFDPRAFDLAATNARLPKPKRPASRPTR